MKRLFATFLIFTLLYLVLSASSQKEYLLLQSNDSYFSEFWVVNNKIYIKYILTIQNSDSVGHTFTISADFSDDKRLNLLKELTLFVCDNQDDKQKFDLNANSSKSFECVFLGQYGGTMLKHDRRLPENIVFHQIK